MDFRPISCCTTFFKAISKILSTRLQTILPKLIGPEQAAFIKERNIHENIMMSQSLVKGYGRKYLTPRCCITSSWFSLKINGSVHGFFQGKSGLTQGKVQLLNSVIFGLTNFWCATALLPKNIIKALNKLCKDFFWSIEDGQRRLIFKSWKSICSPWQEGGFNMKELLSWNKALLAKWLWILEVKKSGLWFEWTQAYHLTNNSIWTLQSKSHYTESLRSILIIRDELLSKTGSTTAAVSLLESWFHNGKLVSVRPILGKSLAIINRCILCKQDNETHSHLFFNYDFSSKIWDDIQRWLKISGRSCDAESELLWCSDRRHVRHWKNGWLRDSIAASCYYIWDERNSRVFKGLERTTEQLLHVIRVTVSSRILSKISCLHYEMGAGRLNLVSI
ncbi:uncharacterized protein LOC141594956 [Silene latifolia]|uniref:uncharacterized protein LOC141594956 n=1 Tax=Silene latifolia TaxID=37657 RepID=UPI003D77DEF6